ncbi:MAG: peroxiredoxin [Sandaracinaceae bacterium]|nr:peroxiredoxin [Sandaracinaceae bacterium]
MRRVFAPLLALALTACGAATAAGTVTPAALLEAGAEAPDFMAFDQHGEVRSMSLLRRRRPMVLFFYPHDGTPGCTEEACALRDAWTRLQAAGAVVVGVSTDGVEAHARFAEEHELPFPLLSDPDGEVLARYGVPAVLGMSARVTFLIDGDGRIARVYPAVDPAVHADEVIEAVTAMSGAR